MAKRKSIVVKESSVGLPLSSNIADEKEEREAICSDIERLKKELADVENTIFKLDVEALRNPVPFGKLQFPEEPVTILTESQKERYRNANLMEVHRIQKILGGLRLVEYEPDPERFIVEINVMDNHASYVKPSYVTVNKMANGGYEIGPCRLPHVRILRDNKKKYPLGDKNQLKVFLNRVATCCEAYEDRKMQVNELKACLEPETFTVFHDSTVEFIEVGITVEPLPDEKIVCKLRIYYKLHHNVPHDYKIVTDNIECKEELETQFRILKNLSLVEAFKVIYLKNDVASSVPGEEGVQEEEVQMRTEDSKSGSVKKKHKVSVRRRSAGENKFNFSDSSEDDMKTLRRRVKEKAFLNSSISKKTYVEKRSNKDVEESSSSSDEDDDRRGKQNNAKQRKKGNKRMNLKHKTAKKSKLEHVRKETDSELSDSDESDASNKKKRVSKKSKQTKKITLAPIFQKPSTSGTQKKTGKSSVASKNAREGSALETDRNASVNSVPQSPKKKVIAGIFKRTAIAKAKAGNKLDSPPDQEDEGTRSNKILSVSRSSKVSSTKDRGETGNGTQVSNNSRSSVLMNSEISSSVPSQPLVIRRAKDDDSDLGSDFDEEYSKKVNGKLADNPAAQEDSNVEESVHSQVRGSRDVLHTSNNVQRPLQNSDRVQKVNRVSVRDIWDEWDVDEEEQNASGEVQPVGKKATDNVVLESIGKKKRRKEGIVGAVIVDKVGVVSPERTRHAKGATIDPSSSTKSDVPESPRTTQSRTKNIVVPQSSVSVVAGSPKKNRKAKDTVDPEIPKTVLPKISKRTRDTALQASPQKPRSAKGTVVPELPESPKKTQNAEKDVVQESALPESPNRTRSAKGAVVQERVLPVPKGPKKTQNAEDTIEQENALPETPKRTRRSKGPALPRSTTSSRKESRPTLPESPKRTRRSKDDVVQEKALPESRKRTRRSKDTMEQKSVLPEGLKRTRKSKGPGFPESTTSSREDSALPESRKRTPRPKGPGLSGSTTSSTKNSRIPVKAQTVKGWPTDTSKRGRKKKE